MGRNKIKIRLSNHQKILGAKYCFQNAAELLEEAKREEIINYIVTYQMKAI